MPVGPIGDEASEPPGQSDRSLAALLSDLGGEGLHLVRQQFALLGAEMREKFRQAGRGATLLAAGAVIAFSGWLVLLAAAVLGLATEMSAWLAALIVAVSVLAVGIVLLLLGRSRLEAHSLLPQRSLRSLHEDQVWLSERLR